MPVNPILAAAAADFLVGMLWYSDYAFGPLFRQVTGQKGDTNQDFYLRIALQGVSSIMIAIAFYIAILTFQKSQLVESQEVFTRFYAWFFTPAVSNAELISSLKIAGFIWLGFFFPAKLSCAVWHPVINWQKFGIKIGGKLAQFLAIAATLAYFG